MYSEPESKNKSRPRADVLQIRHLGNVWLCNVVKCIFLSDNRIVYRADICADSAVIREDITIDSPSMDEADVSAEKTNEDIWESNIISMVLCNVLI